MENEERIPESEEKVRQDTDTALPAARAEHVCAMARALGETAPTARTLIGFKEACEKARAALNEAAEAGEQGIEEARTAIDTALIDLSRQTLEKQTAHVQEYESLSAALHAQADRQAALEILTVSVPLIETEEKQDEVLTEAMAYCKLQQSEELVYSVDGVKMKMPVYKTTAEAAEKVRTAFVDRYNHQPSRQRFCEELEDACKAEAEKEKIEKAARRTAKKSRRAERKAYLGEHPEVKKERDAFIGKGLLFLVPAAALLVCGLMFEPLKKDSRTTFAFILLLLAGAVAGYFWAKKRIDALYLTAEAGSETLKTAEEEYRQAEKRVKAQTASVREAIRRYTEFRKTYLK